MPKYRVAIQVINIYYLKIEANDEGDACDAALEMEVAAIEKDGYLKSITTGHAEVMEVIDDEVDG